MSNRELRPYQIEAINAITTGLADGGSGQLHAACGSGKTIMAMRAAEQLTGPDGLVVVLAPSLGLVAQILGDWKADSSITYQRFAVCSDETVTGKNDDTATVHTDELGVPVSTDRDQIAKWLTAEGPRLIVGTYLSANRLAAAARRAGRELDMLICDEAHHLAGAADTHTRRIMDPSVLPARRRLYVTATPRNGRGRDDEQHDTRTLSMDDETAFGPVLYSYPFSRGIAEGYLADYRIAVIGVTDQEVRALLNRDDIEYVDGIGLRTAAAQVALARAYRDFGMRRAITFHGSVADAQRFVETLPATLASLPQEASAPAPLCLHANGAMDSEQRRAALESLKNVPDGHWAVCSNVRCLSEGVDVPALDGVLFGNPKRSTVDIVQAASRALRLHPDVPGLSTIIVPVVVPDESGEVDAIDPGAYEALFQILRALKEHDDVLSAELDAARADIKGPICIEPSGANEGNGVDDDPHATIGVNPEASGTGEEPIAPGKPTPTMSEPRLSKIEFHGIAPRVLAELRLLVLRQTTSAWLDGYAQAAAFFRAHGHLAPQRGDDIYKWVINQRYDRSKGDLSPDRIAKLDQIAMIWTTRKTRTEQALEAARQFRSAHGHLRVPTSYVSSDGFELGKWLTQVRARGAGSVSFRAELDALGMEWISRRASRWAATLAELAAFKEAHGHLRVPDAIVTPAGVNLSNWLVMQRRRAKLGLLPDERRRELEQVGMTWSPFEERWERGLAAAQAFRARHGHLAVPDDCVFDAFPLGAWIGTRRQEAKNGRLSDERKRALNELGMIWTVRSRDRAKSDAARLTAEDGAR